MNLRARPEWNAPYVAVVPNRTEVLLLAEENGWYLVQTNGITGYINGKYILQ